MNTDEAVSLQRYKACKTWQERVSIISAYHTVKSLNDKNWFIKDTASHFEISIGLVSESIRLAMAIDDNEFVMHSKTREEALKLIERRRYSKDRKDPVHIKDHLKTKDK